MEVADGKGNVKEVHQLAGVLQGKWKRGNTNIAKDKDGKILTTEGGRLAVFKDFYEVKFASASISSDIVPTLIELLKCYRTYQRSWRLSIRIFSN